MTVPGVTFVGAGPGPPGLMTVRGLRALAEAHVVVYDAELPEALLDAVPPDAERIAVSGAAEGGVPPHAVPALLVERARAGRSVVRLIRGDGGDAGREAALVAQAEFPVDVVPGVSLGPLLVASFTAVKRGEIADFAAQDEAFELRAHARTF